MVYLLDHEVTHLGADGSTSNVVTYVAHAVTQAGRDRLTRMTVRAGGQHRILHAYAVDPSGQRIEASSIRRRTVRFRQLSIGSTVVLQYRIDSRPNGYMSGHLARSWWFQGVGTQMSDARWVLWVPEGTQVQQFLRGAVTRTDTKQENMTRIEWAGRNLPAIIGEPAMPRLNEVAAHVSVSTVPHWDMFWKWEEALLVDAFRETPEIVKLAHQLAKGASHPKEVVERIQAYLMKEIRYQQDYEKSIAGVKPHPAPMVVARQYGDCKDKAVLFITLARILGIQVHFALVRTRTVGPVNREVPMQQFNHAIVYVPEQEGIPEARFYDPTVDALDVDVLRHDDQGTWSLVFDPVNGGHTWRWVDFQAPDLDRFGQTVNAEVSPDGGISAEVTVTAKGRVGEVLRKAARNEEGFKQLLARQFAPRFAAGAELGTHAAIQVTDVESPARVSFSFKAPNVARREGKSMRMKVPIAWNPADWFVLPERRHALLMGSPRTQSWSMSIKLPAGSRVLRVPDALVEKSECLHFERRVSHVRTAVNVEQTVSFKCERIESADYSRYRALATRVAAGLNGEIVFSAPSKRIAVNR